MVTLGGRLRVNTGAVPNVRHLQMVRFVGREGVKPTANLQMAGHAQVGVPAAGRDGARTSSLTAPETGALSSMYFFVT